ncbi:MAG: hypothetical protein PHT12_02870 [Patescibacteria group bacterium]|nr:hypothetical protein [Patescibacteria group bacterium]
MRIVNSRPFRLLVGVLSLAAFVAMTWYLGDERSQIQSRLESAARVVAMKHLNVSADGNPSDVKVVRTIGVFSGEDVYRVIVEEAGDRIAFCDCSSEKRSSRRADDEIRNCDCWQRDRPRASCSRRPSP